MKTIIPAIFIVVFSFNACGNRTQKSIVITTQDTLFETNSVIKDSSLVLKLCAKGDIDSLKILLAQGYDINYKETFYEEIEEYGGCGCKCEKSAIYVAAKQQNIELVDFLIENGAIVYSTKYGLQALEPVLKKRNYALADLLLANGANKNDVSECQFWGYETSDKYYSYYNMLEKGDTFFINYLITNQFPYPTQAYRWFQGPVHRATIAGDINILKQLIPLSKEKDELGNALCFSKRIDISDLLLDNGADINYIYHWMGEGNSGREYSPLYTAISTENIDFVKYFIKKGADSNIFFERYNRKELELPSYFVIGFPLLKAVDIGNIAIAELLIENGADVNFAVKQFCYPREYKGRKVNELKCWISPLINAVEKNDVDMVRFLIEKGAQLVIDGDTIANYTFGKDINPLIIKELRQGLK